MANATAPATQAEQAGLKPGDRCPTSGAVISFTREEWRAADEIGTCYYCGGQTRFRVRGSDLAPWARALTHKVPAAGS